MNATAAPPSLPVTDPQDIAIVGGGMAGLFSALLLARDGHRHHSLTPAPPRSVRDQSRKAAQIAH